MITVDSFLIWAQGMVTSYGYPGIFVVSFLGTVSLFLPTFPLSALIVLSVAMKLNPVILAIIAGFGSATGELVGYGVGAGSKKFLLEKHKKKIDKIERLFLKYKGGVTIFAFSFIPIVPVDLMGMFSGTIGYGIKKFYVACLAGKILRYLTIALGAYYGISFVTDMLEIPY